MKKYLAFFLSIALFVCIFSSCSVENDDENTTTNTESTTVVEEETEKAIDSNLKRQLILLSNSVTDWLNPRYDEVAFAVTDMNQNGLLEIIVSSYDSETMTSSTQIYEISSSYDGLNIFSKTNINGKVLEPDYVLFDGTCYYDASIDDYRFLNYDVTLSEDKRNIDLYSINFGEGKADATFIGSMTESLSDETDVIYKNSDGETITEDDYSQLYTDTFEDCLEYYANIAWAAYSIEDLDQFVNSDQATIYSVLEESCKLFSMEK